MSGYASTNTILANYMKIRKLGSRENLVYRSSTNFLMLFDLDKNCDTKRLLLNANTVLKQITLFSCYVNDGMFYYLNDPPKVKIEPKLTIQELIKKELSRIYVPEQHWINIVFHVETNSLLISIEHTLGDVSTLIKFVEHIINAYHNDIIGRTPVSEAIENLLPLNKVNSLGFYGDNKGGHKSTKTTSITYNRITLEELFKTIHWSYLDSFEVNGMEFDLTIDLRKFYKDFLKDKLGYYSHMISFHININSIDSFYKELSYTLSSITNSTLPSSFRHFFEQRCDHKLACSVITEKSFNKIDKKIISNIRAYGNAFYFNKRTFLSFLFITIFNGKLNICFCYDKRTINDTQADKFMHIFCEKYDKSSRFLL